MWKVYDIPVPRLLAIIIAVFSYILAMFALVRKRKKGFSLDTHNENTKPAIFDQEKRIYPRVRLNIGVRYRPYGKKGQIQIFREGKGKNISEAGINVETGECFSVSDLLEMKLKLPTASQFILVRGKIVWVREITPGTYYGYGVSFTEIDPNDRKIIAKFIAENKEELKNNENSYSS